MVHSELDRGVLGRAFTVLDALVCHSNGVGLTWIAHSCGIPKTTTHRLLHQLEALGVVERSDGRYRVGSHVFRLGQAWEPYPHLLTAAGRPLQELAVATRISAVLTVRCHSEDLIVAACLARTEDAAQLRPGYLVPPSLDLVTAPVVAPTGQNLGMVAVVAADHRRRDFFGHAARHAARAINAELARSGDHTIPIAGAGGSRRGRPPGAPSVGGDSVPPRVTAPALA